MENNEAESHISNTERKATLEQNDDDPPSLLQLDEGFSFQKLKVVDYTTNEEDFQEVLLQGYGENNLFASGHYVKLESWDSSVLLTIEYQRFLVRGLIYQDHSQVYWYNEKDSVNKIYLFEELNLDIPVSGAMSEYVIDLLVKEIQKHIITRYGISTLEKDILIVGKEDDVSLFTSYWNSSIEEVADSKIQHVLTKVNPMLMYTRDHTIPVPEQNESCKDYSIEVGLADDINAIKEEWKSNGVALSEDFDINLEEKLKQLVYVCKKDDSLQSFAILEEILFKEAGVVELLLTYSFEHCSDTDAAMKELLHSILHKYFNTIEGILYLVYL
jgi:hypothetical protein